LLTIKSFKPIYFTSNPFTSTSNLFGKALSKVTPSMVFKISILKGG
jgi:hypothetical protein